MRLTFDLRNETGYDYTLEAKPSETTIVMERRREKSALSTNRGFTWYAESGYGSIGSGRVTPDEPIFIPAGQTVRVNFFWSYDVFDVAGLELNEKVQGQEEQIFKMAFKNTTGLVLLDKTHRYWIELPLQDALKE